MTNESHTILVVDDDPGIRASLRDLLTSEGFEVRTAEDGQDALEQLDSMSVPSMILLDLRMPRLDGWQFLARRDPASPAGRVPVVLLSGLAFIRDAPGVADFLSKPIRTDKLLDCVRRFCRQGAPSGGEGPVSL
jgi:two-component system, NtrC family, response regulator HydG